MPSQYLVVAGNIGVGKSSLTSLLARRFGVTPVFEVVEENPYLADFYDDMPRWGFASQVFFLTRRLQQHQELLQLDGVVVQDRSIYEDAEIFARGLHLGGHLSMRDWRTYYDLYTRIVATLPPPDLVVYLDASVPTLLARIRKRGRDYEQNITADYLTRLAELYRHWAASLTRTRVVAIDTDALDYVTRPADFESLITSLRAGGVAF